MEKQPRPLISYLHEKSQQEDFPNALPPIPITRPDVSSRWSPYRTAIPFLCAPDGTAGAETQYLGPPAVSRQGYGAPEPPVSAGNWSMRSQTDSFWYGDRAWNSSPNRHSFFSLADPVRGSQLSQDFNDRPSTKMPQSELQQHADRLDSQQRDNWPVRKGSDGDPTNMPQTPDVREAYGQSEGGANQKKSSPADTAGSNAHSGKRKSKELIPSPEEVSAKSSKHKRAREFWTLAECEGFFEALALTGKDYAKIKKRVSTKSSEQVCQFYHRSVRKVRDLMQLQHENLDLRNIDEVVRVLMCWWKIRRRQMELEIENGSRNLKAVVDSDEKVSIELVRLLRECPSSSSKNGMSSINMRAEASSRMDDHGMRYGSSLEGPDTIKKEKYRKDSPDNKVPLSECGSDDEGTETPSDEDAKSRNLDGPHVKKSKTAVPSANLDGGPHGHVRNHSGLWKGGKGSLDSKQAHDRPYAPSLRQNQPNSQAPQPSFSEIPTASILHPPLSQDDLIRSLGSKLSTVSIPQVVTPPFNLSAFCLESRQVIVYEGSQLEENILGEIVISPTDTIADVRRMIIEELGQDRNFSMLKRSIPLHVAQNHRPAFHFFKSSEDFIVIRKSTSPTSSPTTSPTDSSSHPPFNPLAHPPSPPLSHSDSFGGSSHGHDQYTESEQARPSLTYVPTTSASTEAPASVPVQDHCTHTPLPHAHPSPSRPADATFADGVLRTEPCPDAPVALSTSPGFSTAPPTLRLDSEAKPGAGRDTRYSQRDGPALTPPTTKMAGQRASSIGEAFSVIKPTPVPSAPLADVAGSESEPESWADRPGARDHPELESESRPGRSEQCLVGIEDTDMPDVVPADKHPGPHPPGFGSAPVPVPRQGAVPGVPRPEPGPEVDSESESRTGQPGAHNHRAGRQPTGPWTASESESESGSDCTSERLLRPGDAAMSHLVPAGGHPQTGFASGCSPASVLDRAADMPPRELAPGHVGVTAWPVNGKDEQSHGGATAEHGQGRLDSPAPSFKTEGRIAPASLEREGHVVAGRLDFPVADVQASTSVTNHSRDSHGASTPSVAVPPSPSLDRREDHDAVDNNVVVVPEREDARIPPPLAPVHEPPPALQSPRQSRIPTGPRQPQHPSFAPTTAPPPVSPPTRRDVTSPGSACPSTSNEDPAARRDVTSPGPTLSSTSNGNPSTRRAVVGQPTQRDVAEHAAPHELFSPAQFELLRAQLAAFPYLRAHSPLPLDVSAVLRAFPPASAPAFSSYQA